MKDWNWVDSFNNKIKCVNGVVKVCLYSESTFKEIGFYNSKGNFIKGYPNPLDSVRHKFHKLNGYGVNYWAVEHLDGDDKVVVFITQEGNYYIQKSDIKNMRGIKQFSKQGYELQHVIPLSMMTRIKSTQTIDVKRGV